MVDKIVFDDHSILINKFDMDIFNGLRRISIEFPVKSEEYHDITTLLYKGEFDVHVPAKEISFRGKIVEYSTSVTNLYESEQVGTFQLTLLEVKE
ncbi:DUF3219 family protein [Bacillus sp. ISL-37]|uniref:DUF3219 family protein n=1 Tax=Bacillus sp. ISL-37 TaxID=2819123 RepID=UPI001BE8FD0A|nr:DUF3219 family protein [Bacillus sp. ISL-37]MBT2684952.1 DUF3219 family protein [Bacillus sp. ISL-37]